VILGLDALKLLKDRNFAIFLFHQSYLYPPASIIKMRILLTSAGIENPTVKWLDKGSFILTVNSCVFCSVTAFKNNFSRYVSMGFCAALYWLIYAYNWYCLHGICYDFFCFWADIYQLKSKYKSAAQGLITLATYGVEC
jgi:hypothetical protein